jgi:hypothetical protein
MTMNEFKIGRRRFAIGAAAAATTALIRPGEALAQSSATSQPAAAPTGGGTTLEQQAQAAMAKLQPAARAEVEMKVGEILRKYGEKLSQEQKADIRKVMAENQDGLEKIRAFVLLNGDQPATVYRPYRKEGKK